MLSSTYHQFIILENDLVSAEEGYFPPSWLKIVDARTLSPTKRRNIQVEENTDSNISIDLTDDGDWETGDNIPKISGK